MSVKASLSKLSNSSPTLIINNSCISFSSEVLNDLMNVLKMSHSTSSHPLYFKWRVNMVFQVANKEQHFAEGCHQSKTGIQGTVVHP